VISMAEMLKEIEKKQRNAAKLGTIGLALAMLTMAIWGWTPLKHIIPAVYTLGLFTIFVVFAIALTVLSVYRGMQARAQKAKIEDS